MDIIYCNKCCRRKNDKTETDQFYVSSCKHVLCAECMDKKCAKCGNKCKWVLISRNMPASSANLFAKPKTNFHKFQEAFQFYVEQESEFCKYTLDVIPPQLRKIAKNCEGLQKLDDRLRKEIGVEKRRIDRLKAYLAHAETPCTQTQPKEVKPESSLDQLDSTTNVNHEINEETTNVENEIIDSD